MKKLRIMLAIICMLNCLVGCSAQESPQETPRKTFVSEEEIVAANVEYRARTTGYGGVRGYDPYLTIMYVKEDGTLNVEDHQLRDDYSGFTYEVILTKGDENKIVRSEEGQKEILEIYLTQQLYEQVFNKMNS